ncbi:MAG: 2-C-methyl-D-erythritol 2,4-cyclodiphosphate synthase [Bdellovibrionales bacterium]|nr:2-C-methyl-D-erythritol 2,4-cyclodiphosphate synthase [Bdellovibrionales bacterium]
MAESRVGFGYDVHKLVAGKPLILGGVRILSPYGLEGHSDADVLLHAITDGVLGAAGKRDIGFYFPNTNPKWEGASSLEFLRQAVEVVSEDGWSVVNIDSTVVAEVPKIQPHIDKMKETLAPVLRVSVEACGIKATTNETLGFIGRGEGMAAFAVALLARE